jgi:hypothetical protein
LGARSKGTRKVIKSADLSTIFDIEMDTGSLPKAKLPKRSTSRAKSKKA